MGPKLLVKGTDCLIDIKMEAVVSQYCPSVQLKM
jgi:hypothetical protein